MAIVLTLMLCLFPVQMLLGICGNALNLLVLLSKQLRSRTNTLLAATAVADMIFLLAMAPHYMARFPYFLRKQTDECLKAQLTEQCVTLFHRFYVDYKVNLTFLANWFSAASCWLIVTVSFERLLAIKMPLHARNSACSRRLCALLAVIFGSTAALTFHHNIAYRVERIMFEGDEQNNGSRLFRHRLVPQQREYVQGATIANIVLVIACPLIVLAVVNSFLIYYLRHRQNFLTMGGARLASIRRTRDRVTSESSSCSKTLGSGRDRAGAGPLAGERRSNVSQWSRQMTNSQRKVTLMVAVIVTSYFISHTPSACLSLFMYFSKFSATHPITSLTFTLSLLSNLLVITGKVANFFLFCTSSAHFRSRLCDIICGTTPKRRRILSQTKLMSIPIADRGTTPVPTPRSWHDDHPANVYSDTTM